MFNINISGRRQAWDTKRHMLDNRYCKLAEYVNLASEMLFVTIPPNHNNTSVPVGVMEVEESQINDMIPERSINNLYAIMQYEILRYSKNL